MKHALLSLRFDRAVFFLVFACVLIAAEHLELIALHRFLTLCVFRFVNRTLPSRPPLTQSEFYDSFSSSFFSPSQTDRCTPRLPDANYFFNELLSSHTYSSALIECIISLFFRFHSFSVLSSDPVTSIYTSLCPSNPTFPEGVIALHVTLSVCPENNYASSTSSSIYGLGLTIRNAPAPNTEIVSSGEQQIAL